MFFRLKLEPKARLSLWRPRASFMQHNTHAEGPAGIGGMGAFESRGNFYPARGGSGEQAEPQRCISLLLHTMPLKSCELWSLN